MYDLTNLVWPITMCDVETFFATSALTLLTYGYAFGQITKYKIKRREKKEGKEAARNYAKRILNMDGIADKIFLWNAKKTAEKYLFFD